MKLSELGEEANQEIDKYTRRGKSVLLYIAGVGLLAFIVGIVVLILGDFFGINIALAGLFICILFNWFAGLWGKAAIMAKDKEL
jgi:hypothetical protein